MAEHGAVEIDVALHDFFYSSLVPFSILWTNLTLIISPLKATDMDLEHPGLKHEFFILKKHQNLFVWFEIFANM